MRHTHKAGDRLFVDYSGKKPCVVDPDTGEMRTAELFVAVLGASDYLYAEATETQKARDFCESVRRTLEFLGGVPRAIVPDNLNSAVIQFKKDDIPVLNESFRDLTEHYQIGVLPARPKKPRDNSLIRRSDNKISLEWLGNLLRYYIFNTTPKWLNQGNLTQVCKFSRTLTDLLR